MIKYNPEKRRQYYLNRRDKELARNKLWREQNREHHLQVCKDWYLKDKLNTVKYLLKYAKSRAKKKNLSFSITADDIVIPELCPIFKVPLVPGDARYCPSIDRIDPTKGYIPGNIQIISSLANKIKWDSSADELKAFCTGYLSLLEGGNCLC